MYNTFTPRAWIGCVACYNAGLLTGEWYETSAEILAFKCPIDDTHEEMWIYDHEDFNPFLIGECSVEDAVRFLSTIEEADLSDQEAEALQLWGENVGGADIDYVLDEMREYFVGVWDTAEDYALELASDVFGETVDAGWPFNCIDWELAARELETGGDVTFLDGLSHVFVFRY